MHRTSPRRPDRAPLVLAAALGATWGTVCITALRLDARAVVTVTDAWWSWAAVLGVLALLSRSLRGNLAAVLAGGGAALGSYYLLKAAWSVGYPSRSHGFWDHLASAAWGQWMLPVLVAALPAAALGTLIRRLAAPPAGVPLRPAQEAERALRVDVSRS
ncbi:hypothetical protein BF93_14710 [Brachybacterium phenoliresistens]|uniref:Uncharacterized protein n=1 Tax=Brachybacterium phenoliresistens TaxID=396014 RepID=Z9JVL5_9MICO|nr:hypothetical protein [Brachybacterium phenoliresistens]EWS81827.1 hypothetical protein BF93_14710 [Brachybacterium phenoliresistens]